MIAQAPNTPSHPQHPHPGGTHGPKPSGSGGGHSKGSQHQKKATRAHHPARPKKPVSHQHKSAPRSAMEIIAAMSIPPPLSGIPN